MTTPNRGTSTVRRLLAAVAAVFVGFTVSLAFGAPASAAGVGWVRLAHLSPDTPGVDVYLTSVSGGFSPKIFKAVGYGTVSPYLALPAGSYTVAMRSEGAAPNSAPVISTSVHVVAGDAYTVAGEGRYADLGLKVISDDLSLPPAGAAKVRVIEASVRQPDLNVATVGGSVIASDAKFATTTAYQQVTPGTWTMKVQPVGGGTATTLKVDLAAGGVYSVIILDGKDGLSAALRTDARSGGVVIPAGGVGTGEGGTASQSNPYPMIALGAGALVLVLGAGFVLVRTRRQAA